MEQYKQLIVDENNDFYIIKCMDNNNNCVNTLKYKKDDMGVMRLYGFLSSYMSRFKVNAINRPVLCSLVLLDNSTKKIQFNICKREFKIINQMLLENYFKNRDLFFRNSDINCINLSASYKSNKFENTDNGVNLVLNADTNMNINVSEREFIRNLLEYRCCGRKIDITSLADKKTLKKEWVISCGEFRMVFPTGYTYSTIIGIINDHNDFIDENRKRR